MPNVEITYTGLIRTAVGRRNERLDMAQGATLGELLQEVVRHHGPGVRRFLFDDDTGLPPHAIVIVNGRGVRDMAASLGEEHPVVRILVMSPMMVGG